MDVVRTIGFVGIGFLLASCAVGPDYRRPETGEPAQWQAPLPHGGNTSSLVDWWKQFDDPVVAELIAIAERDSPTLDQALARIGQSRASVTAARSALYPSLDLNASKTRSGDHPVAYEQTITRGSFDAAWELDLFGANRRGSEAAEARLQGAQAAWHDARISLAAEVALEYAGLRSCEARLDDAESELASRRATEKMTLSKVGAGFAAPADGALAKGSAAEGATRMLAMRVECEIGVKALAALTGEAEPALRIRLAPRHGKLPRPATLIVDQLPARVIGSRPDVAVAERNLAAANADIGVAEAARYPQLSLLGLIGRQRNVIDGVQATGRTWSFGPQINLPLVDAGRRAADADAARARYEEALAAYKGRVRGAVREVEQALVRLGSAAEREAEARRAADGYDEVFRAANQRWHVGIGSQLDLEETRRLAIGARSQHQAVQYDNVAAWIGLYRAVGGGWTAEAVKAGSE
jgi:NodT family efflux transporter outer membrane factor (OMF) lipoprotein